MVHLVGGGRQPVHPQYMLGKLYLTGQGVTHDHTQAGVSTTFVRSVHLMLHCALDREVKEWLIAP